MQHSELTARLHALGGHFELQLVAHCQDRGDAVVVTTDHATLNQGLAPTRAVDHAAGVPRHVTTAGPPTERRILASLTAHF